jgi:DegV family protein with EDD domain
VTDTVASLPAEVARELGIEIVSLHLHFDGEDHLESEMDLEDFYVGLDARVDNPPTSSQPSVHDMESVFESAALVGDDVCAIFLSAELSGTLDGALRSARLVRSHNLDFRCVVIDGRSAGGDLAFAAVAAAKARNAGASLEDCAAAAEHAILSSRILFAPESLAFLKAGGRIGAASALLGSLIKITPVLTVRDGRADTFTKVRTHAKAISAMADAFAQDVAAHGLRDVVVHYIGKKGDALAKLHAKIQEIAGREVRIVPISPVLGTHVGSAVGVAYECMEYLEGKITEEISAHVYTV